MEESYQKPRHLTNEELEELVRYAMEDTEPVEVEGVPFYKKPRQLWYSLKVVIVKVGKTAGREKRETIIAVKILRRYMIHNDITDEEKKFLKEQSIDLARIIPIVLVQAVPAPVPITPFLIMFGKKIGIDLVPKEQQIPNTVKTKPPKNKGNTDLSSGSE